MKILKFNILFIIILFGLAISLIARKEPNLTKIFIDNTYVINLKNSKNRYESVKKEFLKYNIQKYTRFEAIDGMKIEITDFDNMQKIKTSDIKNKIIQFNPNNIYKIECDQDYYFNYKYTPYSSYNNIFLNLRELRVPLKLGEIGCACSHLKVYQDIIGNKYKNSLVFEDDFVLKDNFSNNLQNVLDNIPKSCDIIYLHHTKDQKSFFNKIFSRLIYGHNSYVNHAISFRFMSSNAAYIITENGAKKITEYLKNNNMKNMGIDHYIYHILAKNDIIHACLTPQTIVSRNNNFVSDIDSLDNRNL